MPSARARLWDMHSGDPLHELAVDIDTPPVGAFGPGGDDLFYADGSPDTGYVLRRFPVDTDELTDLAESRITRGFTDEECRRYELAGCVGEASG